jgi:PadR family transcriptional regulator, regulatory protein AphA
MSLKYAILGLLDEEPRYGYEIKQEFDHTMGDLWPVSYGQLYPTLRRLTQEELVTVQVVQGKKAVDKHVYSITEEGKSAFLLWLERKNKKMITSIKDEFSLSLFFIEKMDEKVMTLMLDQLHEKSVRKLKKIKAVSLVNQEQTPFYRKLLMRKMELFVEAEELWLRELRIETKLRNGDKPNAP